MEIMRLLPITTSMTIIASTKNFIGIPTEGIAISNDPKFFVMPRFKDHATLTLSSANKSLL